LGALLLVTPSTSKIHFLSALLEYNRIAEFDSAAFPRNNFPYPTIGSKVSFGQLRSTLSGISFHKHSVHKKWIVEMTLARESHCMTAPLAHGSWRKDTRRPEDKPL
jgi:hypothetical protein